MLPIAVVILFSFNKPAGRFNYVWEEFTLDNWVNWNAVLGIQDAGHDVARGGPAGDSCGDSARHPHCGNEGAEHCRHSCREQADFE